MKYICSCYIIIVIFLFPGSNCLAFDKPGPFFPDISVFLFAKFLNDKNIFSKKQTQLSQRIEENLFSIPDIKLLPAWRKSLILYVCVPPTPPAPPPRTSPAFRDRGAAVFLTSRQHCFSPIKISLKFSLISSVLAQIISSVIGALSSSAHNFFSRRESYKYAICFLTYSKGRRSVIFSET